MVTKRPIATISYNTESYLVNILNRLIYDHTIDFWACIRHFPEGDSKKFHWHVFILPNNKIDTDFLKDAFKEPDLSFSFDGTKKKPLGIIDCHCSKFDDWYLYSIHDPEYLSSKGQEKEYSYKRSDFLCSDEDAFDEKIARICYGNYKRQLCIISALDAGKSVAELLRSGLIPINQYKYWTDFVANYVSK